ncbi:hypothetical protein CEXT_361741, partial [Caerostris extrusa]
YNSPVVLDKNDLDPKFSKSNQTSIQSAKSISCKTKRGKDISCSKSEELSSNSNIGQKYCSKLLPKDMELFPTMDIGVEECFLSSPRDMLHRRTNIEAKYVVLFLEDATQLQAIRQRY